MSFFKSVVLPNEDEKKKRKGFLDSVVIPTPAERKRLNDAIGSFNKGLAESLNKPEQTYKSLAEKPVKHTSFSDDIPEAKNTTTFQLGPEVAPTKPQTVSERLDELSKQEAKISQGKGDPSPAQPIAERIKTSYTEKWAREDRERLLQDLQEGGGKLPKQTTGSVLKGTSHATYLPFVGGLEDINEAVKLFQSVKRLERGEETEVDLYRITLARARAEQDKTFGAKVASVLTQLPSFAGELLLTGGIFTVTKKATQKAAQETLEKYLGKKAGSLATRSVGSLAGATAQTIPARFTQGIAGTIQNMIPEYQFEESELSDITPYITGTGDNVWRAAAKSFSDQWVEVVSEKSGGIFNEALAPVKNQIMKIAILKAILKANPAAKPSQFMELVRRAGWNGIIAEMGEERVGEVMRGILSEVGLSDEGWSFPDSEQLLVELVAFSIPGVMIGGANTLFDDKGSSFNVGEKVSLDDLAGGVGARLVELEEKTADGQASEQEMIEKEFIKSNIDNSETIAQAYGVVLEPAVSQEQEQTPGLVEELETIEERSKETAEGVIKIGQDVTEIKETVTRIEEKLTPIREADGVKIKVPTFKTAYNKGVIVKGKYKDKPYTTDTFVLEFEDVKVQTTRDEGPTSDAVHEVVNKTKGAKDLGAPVEVITGGTTNQVIFKLGKEEVVMDAKYYNYLSSKYKGLVLKGTSPQNPIGIYDGKAMKGVVMPIIARLSGKEIKSTKLGKKSTPKKAVAREEETEDENLASPQGDKSIRKILERQGKKDVATPEEVPQTFKISERARDILTEFGVPIRERELSGRYLGLYKPKSKSIRVQSLYDITTVTHEGIHAIDDQINFTKNLIMATGRGAKVRKQLTEIYVDLYPKGNKNHKLNKRLQEGLAVLFENYFYDPATIAEKYPDLVDAFIRPGGQYYNPLFTKLLDRMNTLVDDYAKLTPEQKIGARVRDGKEIVNDKGKGFTFKQRVVFQVFNRFEPLKRYAKVAGVSETWDDPTVQAFNILNKNSIVAAWVKGKGSAILLRDGNFRVEKGSVKDYMKLVKGKEKTFAQYLVARRVYELNNSVNALKNELEENPENEALQTEITRKESIIRKDDFSTQDAATVVHKYAQEFEEATAIYDKINKNLIDFAEENDLIDSETANTYRAEPGYASFKRYVEDELDAAGTIKTAAQSKVSSFKERTGSNLDIVDPTFSQIMAINEVIGKAMENRLWTKVAILARKSPEVAQRFENIEAKPAFDADGRVSFPQEHDPNIIRVFINGKRVFYKSAPEFLAVSKTLRGREYDTFVQLLRIPSSIFTRLTTSANPFFAAGNFTVDQFSALTQTKTGFKPGIDPAKGLYDFLKSDVGMQAYIALGGKRQTLAAYFDLSPEDVTHKLTGGETKMERVTNVVDSSISVLELPSNISEIITRYSEYKRSVDKGEPMSVAMFRASEVTTPFQLQGAFGGRFGMEVVKSIPYFNAIIQVLYKFGRTTKDNPKRVATVTAGLLTTAITLAILIMKYATDEQKRTLGEQPARDMTRYVYIPAPNGKDLFKIRIPEQMGILTGLSTLYIIGAYGGNKASFDDYADVVEAAFPEQINILDWKKWSASLIPQVLKPTIMAAFNTKTYPSIAPIVPEYMRDIAPEKQHNAYTSDVAKTLGQWFGASPMLIDYWINNQFGPVGKFFVSGRLPYGGKPLYVTEGEYVMFGRSYNQFYESRTLVNQQYDEIIKDNPDEYTRDDKRTVSTEKKYFDKVADILSDVRKIEVEGDIPEEIKAGMYELLLKFDSSEDIAETRDEIRDVQSAIRSELKRLKRESD